MKILKLCRICEEPLKPHELEEGESDICDDCYWFINRDNLSSVSPYYGRDDCDELYKK
jgi:hypothetical protein